MSICLFVMGVLILVYKQNVIKTLCSAAGVLFLSTSVYELIRALQIKDSNYRTVAISRAAASLATALLMIILPWTIAGVLWRFFVYLFSFFLVISGIVAILEQFIYRSYGFYANLTIEGILLIATGLLLWYKPDNLAHFILYIIGFVLIVISIIVFIKAISSRYDLEEVD